MNFKELILSKLYSTPLLEFAMLRDKAEQRANSLGEQITQHLIKVFVWNDIDNRNKYLKDIDGWCVDIMNITLKPNNKRIKSSDMYNWVYSDLHDNGADSVYNSIRHPKFEEYHSLSRNELTYEEVYLTIKGIMKRVTHDMSNGSFKTIKDYI